MAQGLALWRSLARLDAAAVLWVLALDSETEAVLRSIGGERIRILPLADLLGADTELAIARSGRSRQEFIFALTPCLVRHVLRVQPEIAALVYLDADLYFFHPPEPIWAELERGSVLVVAHRFPCWHDDSPFYGRFNVGVIAFRRDHAGHACLDWWRERCLESTSVKGEGGCYGDQKYLDEWPRRFTGVVELKHAGVNVAPWNWAGHRFEVGDHGEVRVDGEPLIVFHFAQFRRVSGRWFDSGQLEYGIMPLRLRSRLYGEYWAALVAAEAEIRGAEPGFAIATRGWPASLGAWHLAILRLAFGQFWLRVGPWWLGGRMGLERYSGRVLAVYRRWQRREP